ncbi:MAG: 3-oxoacyl-ACP synthase III [Desulfobulbus propionicus]|nr:MAG: 3-oxoacyl-ACP synthase III [Desulfobulbus propionicus]
MLFTKVCLHDFGYVLPPNIVTSLAIEERLAPVYERLKLPPGRLELMSGIRERRLWNADTLPSQGAAQAGAMALEKSGVSADEIDCLIFSSVSRDMMEPATASFVHRVLALSPSCHLFDLSNACLGFLNAMMVLAGMIELGQVQSGLIVAGETAENLVETTIVHMLADTTLTRKTIKPLFASLTIGSGAVALVMSDRRAHDTGHYLVGGVCRANTRYNDLCQGGQNSEQGILMSTESEELLHRGVETAFSCWQDFKQETGWNAATVDSFFCHQVGRAHARHLFGRLELDVRKNFETLPVLGNVGSVSAPVTMAMGIDEKALVSGQRAALLGIGSGINSLMLGIDW